MKNKKTAIIILALLILLDCWLGLEYLTARRAFTNLIDLPPNAAYDISIKLYTPEGAQLQVTNPDDKQALVSLVNQLNFAGRTKNPAVISPEDNYYCLMIHSTQQNHPVVIIYLRDKSTCYIENNNHSWLKIANPKELYQLTKQLYKNLNQT